MCNLMHEDAVTSNEKQPVTLKYFLQSKNITKVNSPQKSKETFSCPVCLEILETNFENFNEHVNNCQKFDDFNNNEAKIQESVSKTSPTVTDEKDFSASESFLSDTENIQYICPICGSQPGVANLHEMNIHIDNCLSKTAIKQILASDIQNAPKR